MFRSRSGTKRRRSAADVRRAPSSPPLPTGFSRTASVALGTGLLVSCVFLAAGMRDWQGLAGQLQQMDHQYEAVRARLDQRDLRDLSDFAATETLIHDLALIYHEPLNEAALNHLLGARQTFTAIVEERDDPFFGQERLSDSYVALGIIHARLNETDRASVALRRAIDVLQGRPPHGDADAESFRIAVTSSRLAWTLAARGEYRPAGAAVEEAVRRMTAQAGRGRRDRPCLRELAIAYRNRATIRAALEQRSTMDVSEAVAVGQLLLQTDRAATGDQQRKLAVLDELFHADSLQLQAVHLKECAQFGEATVYARRCVEVLESALAQERLLTIDTGYIPVRRMRAGFELARHNLALLQAGADQATTAGPTPNQWRWTALHPIPTQLVDPGLLTCGRLPGEFEPHEAMLLCWSDSQWCEQLLLKIIELLHDRIALHVLVDSQGKQVEAERKLAGAGVPPGAVAFLHVPVMAPWVRDFGPLAITSAEGTKFLDLVYSTDINRLREDHVPFRLAGILDIPHVPLQIACDGGAILSNGRGMCLVSTRMLQRNLDRGFSQSALTAMLKRLTGAETLVYVEPLEGETTGHLDMFAAFTGPDTLVLGDYVGSDSPNARRLDFHAEQFRKLAPAAGRLKVVRIPMPPPTGTFFPTYANAIFANGIVLVPTWPGTDPQLEAAAMETYRRLLPGWQVIGVPSQDAGLRRGSLHCLTMHIFQLPQPLSRPLPTAATAAP